MAFSDGDLARLKSILAMRKDHPTKMDIDVMALVARMEAAEEFADEAICHCKYDCKECGEMREAWRKSAGKAGRTK